MATDSPAIDMLSFASDIVSMVVGTGTDSVTLTAHKSILLKIPCFEKCLRKEWVESDNALIQLPDGEPMVIQQILQFAYGGKISNIKFDLGELIRQQNEREDLYLVIKTFIAANKFCMEGLQNAITDLLHGYHRHRLVDPTEISLLREISNCKLGELLLQKFAYDFASPGWITMKARDEACKTWTAVDGIDTAEILEAIADNIEHRGCDPMLFEGRCRWHSHTTTQECDP